MSKEVEKKEKTVKKSTKPESNKAIKKETKPEPKKEINKESKPAVKEEKTVEVKTNNVKFDPDKQSKLKFFSKFVYILAKIGKVISIIACIGILIAIICTPVIAKNIKVENGELKVFGERVYYVHGENDITLKYSDIDFGTMEENEVTEFDNLVEELSSIDTTEIFTVAEIYLIISLAMCIVTYMLFNNMDKLFTNFYNLDTPFNKLNLSYIQKMTRLVIVLAVVPYISGLFAALIVKSELLRFDLNIIDLLFVLILFAITYIFEYGVELQKDTNAKIYGEVK